MNYESYEKEGGENAQELEGEGSQISGGGDEHSILHAAESDEDEI